jgi:hypothetical protein
MFKKTRMRIQELVLIISFFWSLRGLAVFLKELVKEGVYQIRRRKNPELIRPL